MSAKDTHSWLLSTPTPMNGDRVEGGPETEADLDDIGNFDVASISKVRRNEMELDFLSSLREMTAALDEVTLKASALSTTDPTDSSTPLDLELLLSEVRLLCIDAVSASSSSIICCNNGCGGC